MALGGDLVTDLFESGAFAKVAPPDARKEVDVQLQPKVEPARAGSIADLLRRPLGAALFAERSVDGLDFIVTCSRHQWASVPSVTRLPTECPLCVAEVEAGRGRDRYRVLHADLAAGRVVIREA